eukprot:g12079.t1
METSGSLSTASEGKDDATKAKLQTELTNRFAAIGGEIDALHQKLNSVAMNATETAFGIERARDNATHTNRESYYVGKKTLETEAAAKTLLKSLENSVTSIKNTRSKFKSDVKNEKQTAKEAKRLTPLIAKELSKSNKESVRAQIDVITKMGDPNSALSVNKLETRSVEMQKRFEKVKAEMDRQVQYDVLAKQAVPRLDRVRRLVRGVGRAKAAEVKVTSIADLY